MKLPPSTALRLNLVAVLFVFACSEACVAKETSALWGRDGENWTPRSRLPDFSFAGYHRGETEIPSLPVAHNLKDFGAVGDGETDDTEALLRAIAAVERGVILVPKGRYRITQIIEITKPNLVLRGESRDQTVLFFPRTLTDVRPNWGATTTGRRTSNYSWSGGFIQVKGDFCTREIAAITAPAARGSQTLQLATTKGLAIGQEIDIRQQDTAENSLARHLYSDEPGNLRNINGRSRTSLITQIAAIHGETITIDRPLRTELRPEWRPAVHRFSPTVVEVGIEDLTFAFPVTDYLGHFTELGYNPIAFVSVANCWIKNIRILNPDSGPFVFSRFCTVDGVIYESARKPDPERNSTGHHGLSFNDGDNLFTHFDFRTQFQHDVTLGPCAAGNVIAGGRAVDMCFDHHCRAPYENLWTDVDVGEGTHVWRSGGGGGLGVHAGARTTFWNIRSRRPLTDPGEKFGPSSMNFVAVTTDDPTKTAPDGRWWEAIPPADLEPQNLYAAQRAKRLGKK